MLFNQLSMPDSESQDFAQDPTQSERSRRDRLSEPKTQDPRAAYLEKIGLKFDPFNTWVAEQEAGLLTCLHRGWSATSSSPQFFSYYSPSRISHQTEFGLLELLHGPRPGLIYGAPGSGKSALRLRLDAEVRSIFDGTLVTSYLLDAEDLEKLPADTHWGRLAQAIAIDMFIQLLEQFNTLGHEPTTEQIQALRFQVALGGHPLRRLIQRILDGPEPSSIYGLGELWPAVGRTTVTYVARTAHLLNVMAHVVSQEYRVESRPSGLAAFEQSIQVARLWGFRRFLILVDNVDAHQRNVRHTLDLILPLIETLPALGADKIYSKFFLPLSLQSRLTTRVKALLHGLRESAFEATIVWDYESLRQLLTQRFRAAGSRRTGFVDVTDRSIAKALDAILFRAAEGSPRRLIQLISGLLEAHVRRGTSDPLIRASDWEDMRTNWGADPPVPPQLAGD